MSIAIDPEPYNVPRVGVGTVVMRKDRALVGLRAGSHAAGEWAFPGGKNDLGETVIETALRENLEEHGLDASEPRKLRYFTEDFFYNRHTGLLERQFLTVFVVCESYDGEPVRVEPEKCLEWRWMRWDDLRSGVLLLMEGTADIVQRYETLDDLAADTFID
jgi:8-oxo-dGTP diphosphatase